MNYATNIFQPTLSKAVEEFLEDLAAALQIPDSLYEEAEQRYRSVSTWLSRAESELSSLNPAVYPQGSFALGTVNKPTSDEEEYDVDMVCEINLSTSHITQKGLKESLLREMRLYAKKYSMQQPEEHRRCVRLQYANEAQFHLDATPAIPDSNQYRALLESQGLDTVFSKTAILITDMKHPHYAVKSEHWPHSNPRGYLKWFKDRMQSVFERRRRAIALQERKANILEIPDYKVRTPLQSAVQILKRHRDMTCEGDPDNKPISIIITTLAAHAYQQETTIGAALYYILNNMERFIEDRNGKTWIGNPVDPFENFADKWAEVPAKKEAFYEWLNKAKADFFTIMSLENKQVIAESMSPVLGHQAVQKAANTRPQSSRLLNLLAPSHKKPLPWAKVVNGNVGIKAIYRRNGFRWKDFKSGELSIPKYCELIFDATTNVPKPYDVYWQVVNTGAEATKANNLRGGFEKSKVELGGLQKKETTKYRGSHTVECFIVRDGLCVAQSGAFVVSIS